MVSSHAYINTIPCSNMLSSMLEVLDPSTNALQVRPAIFEPASKWTWYRFHALPWKTSALVIAQSYVVNQRAPRMVQTQQLLGHSHVLVPFHKGARNVARNVDHSLTNY